MSGPLLPALRNYLNESAVGSFDRYVAAGLLTAAVLTLSSTRLLAPGRRLRAAATLILLGVVFTGVYALLAAPDPGSWVVEAAHFVEYGTLAALTFLALRGLSPLARAAQTLLLVLAVGLVDELVQWMLATRFAEFRDVAVNVAAGLFGLLSAGLVLGRDAAQKGGVFSVTRAELRQVAIRAALVLPVLGGFLYFVHLGHWIRWDDVEFVSRYRAADLEHTAAERRLRWASIPTSEHVALLRPAEDLWGIEDFYATEARRHIQARNRAADAGDVFAATGENRIAERWYAPYVEIAGARRTDLPGDLTGVYRSNVLAHLWPWLAAPSVWAAFIVAEVVLVGLALRLERG